MCCAVLSAQNAVKIVYVSTKLFKYVLGYAFQQNVYLGCTNL